MMDLTKITTPFGLLDAETQEALKAHGGPYEYFNGSQWMASNSVSLNDIDTGLAYRVKPLPPKPREVWSYGDSMFGTEADATAFRARCGVEYPHMNMMDLPIVHWREVIGE